MKPTNLKPPKDVGFIIRTAGIGRSKTEIERDLKYLTRLWETLEKKPSSPSKRTVRIPAVPPGAVASSRGRCRKGWIV